MKVETEAAPKVELGVVLMAWLVVVSDWLPEKEPERILCGKNILPWIFPFTVMTAGCTCKLYLRMYDYVPCFAPASGS